MIGFCLGLVLGLVQFSLFWFGFCGPRLSKIVFILTYLLHTGMYFLSNSATGNILIVQMKAMPFIQG